MAHRFVIAIPSYNRPDALKTLLAQLDAQTDAPTFDVYVLNDGNNPESARLLETFLPHQYRLHGRSTEVPSGLPRARNIMLDWIAKDWNERWNKKPLLVCFLDDDCEVNTKFVQEVYKAAARYQAFCFRIETVGQSGIVNTMNNWLVRWLLEPFIGMVLLPFGFIRGGYFQPLARPRRVDHLPGGCLIYRFDKYPTLRFEETLNDGNAILEDTDFSLALSRAGAKLWYIGSYGIVHRPGTVGGVRVDVPREKYWYYWRHKRFLVRKWLGGWAPITALPFVFLESVLLSFMQKKWLVPVMLRAWFDGGLRTPKDRLRILAPQSGINPRSTLGGEVYDAFLLHALAERGAYVRVMLPKGKVFADGGTSFSLVTSPHHRSSLGYYTQMFFDLWKTYRVWPFQVLRVHSPYTMALPVMLFALFHPRVKLWAHYHHVEERLWFRFLTWLIGRRWDVVTVSSEATQKALITRFGLDFRRMVVAYPGMGAVPAPDKKYVAALRQERGLEGRLTLLHIGSLQARKNVAFLIDLLAQLPPEVVLVIIGQGPEYVRLERQAEMLHVRDRVAFLGAVSEAEKQLWLASADVLVLASRVEGFGMVVAEAALMGTPALVSDRGALPEVVQDGVTGRVCSLDIAAWRDAVMTFLTYKDTARSFGERARKEISGRFSWQKTAAIILRHLQNTI